MATFKERKYQLIEWLKQGNIIEMCSQPGHAFGSLNKTDNCPLRGIQPLINSLLSQGVICYETFYEYGIRWERFKLNENTINSEGK